jgi:hypothetical protein
MVDEQADTQGQDVGVAGRPRRCPPPARHRSSSTETQIRPLHRSSPTSHIERHARPLPAQRPFVQDRAIVALEAARNLVVRQPRQPAVWRNAQPRCWPSDRQLCRARGRPASPASPVACRGTTGLATTTRPHFAKLARCEARIRHLADAHGAVDALVQAGRRGDRSDRGARVTSGLACMNAATCGATWRRPKTGRSRHSAGDRWR